MNPDTTHAEPVDVTINRLERELTGKTNEAERLKKEIDFREYLDVVAQEAWVELKADNIKLREIIERYTNEVASLREELEKAMSMIDRDMQCEAEVARLMEELDRLKRGCQGSCYACEPVGEMNLKLRELLEKVLFDLEKLPFQTPKQTAFTAHILADRYREQLNQLTK